MFFVLFFHLDFASTLFRSKCDMTGFWLKLFFFLLFLLTIESNQNLNFKFCGKKFHIICVCCLICLKISTKKKETEHKTQMDCVYHHPIDWISILNFLNSVKCEWKTKCSHHHHNHNMKSLVGYNHCKYQVIRLFLFFPKVNKNKKHHQYRFKLNWKLNFVHLPLSKNSFILLHLLCDLIHWLKMFVV